MYPFTGYTSNEFSPLEASLLVTERMAFKLPRGAGDGDGRGRHGGLL